MDSDWTLSPGVASLYQSAMSLWFMFFVCSGTKMMRPVEAAGESTTTSSAAADIDAYLASGMAFLSRGHYSDALAQFHYAVEADPKNYLTYFKRATVYMALGRAKSALDDLDESIAAKPDFAGARLQRGTVHMKMGHLDEAHIDFETVLRTDPANEEAAAAYTALEPLRTEIQAAYSLTQDRAWPEAIDLLTRLLNDCPWDVKLREMRSQAFEAIGDFPSAISDLRATTQMRSDNTAGNLKLSRLHYQIGEADESLTAVRDCLKLDPDHKECFSHYKKVKKLASQMAAMNSLAEEKDFAACAEKGQAALKTEQIVPAFVLAVRTKQCTCWAKAEVAEQALRACDEAIKLQKEVSGQADPLSLCDLGDSLILSEQYEEAEAAYRQASQAAAAGGGEGGGGGLRRAKEGASRAAKLIKQSKRRDYYKILGVRRSAAKKEILRAYRKAAQQWHPDNFLSETESVRKGAEAKFIDIAAAKEVLSDPEKRQRFDQGEDPLDPEQQGGHGGFHGGFPGGFGGGGGYTFRFHF